jgi:hypothetical protein
LKDVADNSAIDEFWITDPEGHAVLANREVSFTSSPDPARQPQASAFWPLLTGEKKGGDPDGRKGEIDNQVYKYGGVAGIDRPRIVQVGSAAAHFAAPKQTNAL